MKIWHAVARLNLGILAADHALTSIVAIFFPRLASKVYERMFGVRLSATPELQLVFKPWGALGLFAAIAGVLPIVDPERYRAILYALLVLLMLRVYIRVVNARAVEQHFAMSRRRNWFHIYLIVQAAALITAQLVWW